MDPSRFRTRPFGPDDHEAHSILRSRTLPDLPSTAEEERHWDEMAAASHLTNERWIVEERSSGRVVAVGALNHSPHSFDPHKFWADVEVDPDFTHLGIGRALVALLDSEATEHRATCLWANVRNADPRAKKFAERAGFVPRRTMWMSELDLSRPTPTAIVDRTSELEREGIRFTTLADEGFARPEVRKRLFDLWVESSRDVPRMGDYVPVSFESFTAMVEAPNVMPEAFFLGISGEAYVASSHLERDLSRPDSLFVGFTGTRSAFRGRGIATELKRRSVAYAQEHGYRFLRTLNDSLNPSIWAINEKMGFHRVLEISQLERLLPPPASAAPATPPR
jgi:mycothiol synthase